MQKFLSRALMIGSAMVAAVLPLGAAYIWLWAVVLAWKIFGLAGVSAVLAASLWGLVRLLRSSRQAPFGWYQPWDHGCWMIAERLTQHSWQRSAENGTG